MPMKFIAAALALAPFLASAITVTKEYVDRKDAANAQAATNLVTAATNDFSRTIAAKADAHPQIRTTVGGVSTNETANVVYANVKLMVREVPTANGQKQFRLIRKND